MSCSGCSNAVTKALNRLEGKKKKKKRGIHMTKSVILFNVCVLGVKDVKTDLDKQEVVVDTELPREQVLAAIKKTGKEVKGE